jgi:Glycosyl transferase family 2
MARLLHHSRCWYPVPVPVPQSDVAILIPTYRQRHLVVRAIDSALATGAGEIIVSDDQSGDGTWEVLLGYHDPRLRIVQQSSNLGLWRNHLALLRMASRPWIKFIQQDDWLSPDGLGALAAQADDRVSVVSALHSFHDLETGRTWAGPDLDAPCRWTSDAYMERLLVVGNELGRPSANLYRADVLERSEEAWNNDLSADLVANVMAASRGDVVLLPQGMWYTGEHSGQDSHTQSFRLVMDRIGNSHAYLVGSDDARVRHFASVYCFAMAISSIRGALGALRRGRPLYARYPADCVRLLWDSAPRKVTDIRLSGRCIRWQHKKREIRLLNDDSTVRVTTKYSNEHVSLPRSAHEARIRRPIDNLPDLTAETAQVESG